MKNVTTNAPAANRHQVHNLIILDESGSMSSIKRTIIEGFNEIVQTTKGVEKKYPEQEHFISLVSFNGLGQKILHFIDPVSKLQAIDASRYHPNASTPLFDAIGFAVNKLRQVLDNKTDYHVLVTIMTDGEENASREYSGQSVKKLIKELKQQKWTFTYIGTDHNVEEMASSMSIDNTMRFDKGKVREMFAKETKSRMGLFAAISEKKDVCGIKFYDDDAEENGK